MKNQYVGDIGDYGKYGLLHFLAEHGIRAQGFFTRDSRAKVNRAYKGKVLFLEVGVGGNTPGIVKYSFWEMTKERPDAIYVCLNNGEACAPGDIRKKSICINGDFGEIIDQLS